MKLCTCNHCGEVYEDMNPQTGAKEYPDDPDIQPLIKFYVETSKPETGYWGCPECCTDSYLSDEVDMSIKGIIERKKQGIDCTETQSAFIKGWLRDTLLCVDDGTVDIEADLQFFFPIEYGEYLDEPKTNNV